MLLPEVGERGQLVLLASAVEVVGDGAAAEEAVIYLAAAGVGRIVTTLPLRARVAAMNPDVRLDDGPTDLIITPREPARRASGADAALHALLALTGLGAHTHSEHLP